MTVEARPAGAFLPYGRQVIEDDDIAAVTEALRAPLLTTGPLVGRFEERFAAAMAAPHAVACANGTAALHLATLALNIGEGDRVIVPAVTFVATANAPALAGAQVTFADVAPDTGLMTVETLLEAFDRAGQRVKAVYPVHLAGHCVDMAAIAETCRARDVAIIEDACHAVGGAYTLADGSEAAVGSCTFSDLSCFSLHPVKTITMGEGGVITSGSEALQRRMMLLRSHCLERRPDAFSNAALAFARSGAPNPWYYELPEPGFNYRITDMQCALGLTQLAKLDRFVQRRAVLVDRYRELLGSLAPVVRPLRQAPGCRPAWHLLVVLVDFDGVGRPRADVMAELQARSIGSQVHYIPVNRQPYYARRGAPLLPGAEAYYARSLSLPLFPDMADDDVDRVVEALADTLGL